MTTPQKTSIFLFFLLILLPSIYSISLDELIASYDFFYSDNQIEINTINHYGSNLNGNSLYDDLIINININNEEGGYNYSNPIMDWVLYNHASLVTNKRVNTDIKEVLK